MRLIPAALLLLTSSIIAVTPTPAAAQETTTTADSGEWVSLMDGKTFEGWKISENGEDTWSVEDGAFVAHGPRSHLFYVGDEQPFKNFELKADVKTTSGSNGGIYIHTAWQESGWPREGYEIQVNQTHSDKRKSGSIYAVQDVHEQHVKDDEWYSYHIIVDGKRILVKMNGEVVNDFTEEPNRQPGDDFTRILTSGTIALQGHDPDSIIHYKDIKIKKLN